MIEINPIKPEDFSEAAECVQKAFDSDPYNNWVFDKSKFDKARNKHSLQLKFEWGIRNALFYVAKDPDSSTPSRVLGVAMWVAPNPPATWSATFDAWLLWLRQGIMNIRFGGRGGLNVKRYYIWKERQAEAQSELWTDENGYFFCNIVVVLPGYQGGGVGKKLFETVTKKADQEGRKCYLESSRMVPNVAIYEKMGFRLVKEMRCEEGGDFCDLFCMIRDPKP